LPIVITDLAILLSVFGIKHAAYQAAINTLIGGLSAVWLTDPTIYLWLAIALLTIEAAYAIHFSVFHD